MKSYLSTTKWILLCAILISSGVALRADSVGSVIASGNATIPATSNTYTTVNFTTPVTLTKGQEYWVGVAPVDFNTDQGYLSQNPTITNENIGTGGGSYYYGAYPGEFDVVDTSSNVFYTDMTSDPFNTGHSWVIGGSYGSGFGFAEIDSPFIVTSTGSVDQINVVLVSSAGYGSDFTISLYNSPAVTPVPEASSFLFLWCSGLAVLAGFFVRFKTGLRA